MTDDLPSLSQKPNGFSLVELLFTMVIVLIGLQGLASLQGRMQVSELESFQRAQATLLLSDIVDRILLNRTTASCMAFTTHVPSAGVPYIGTDGANRYIIGSIPCTESTAANQTMMFQALNDMDAQLKGAAESLGGNNVGAMIGARACISHDATSDEYTVAVAWQGVASTVVPADNCANGLYGTNDAVRRVISTTMRIADLG